jgi:hypothetical protein
MSCGGSHLGFPIHIKNRNLEKDIPMIIQCMGILPSLGTHHLSSVNFSHFKLLLRNHWPDQFEPNLAGMFLGWFMYSLALVIFVVSEKKAFEHFPRGSNVNPQKNVCPAVAVILDFRST